MTSRAAGAGPDQPVPVYTAPAARVFAWLHIAEPGTTFDAAPGCEPLTACGQVMTAGDLWQPVERQPGDLVHPECEIAWARSAAPAREVIHNHQAPLWTGEHDAPA